MRPAVAASVLWTVGLALALALPARFVVGWVWGSDTVLHGIVFAVSAALWASAFPRRRRVVGAALVGLAVVSEVGQGTLLPGRGAEWTDLAANLVGIAAGLAFATGARHVLQPPNRRSVASTGRR